MADTINYFKLALQSYCYMVASSENTELAQSLFNENDEEVLKNFIIEARLEAKHKQSLNLGESFSLYLIKLIRILKIPWLSV